jgi:hypothetical protein
LEVSWCNGMALETNFFATFGFLPNILSAGLLLAFSVLVFWDACFRSFFSSLSTFLLSFSFRASSFSFSFLSWTFSTFLRSIRMEFFQCSSFPFSWVFQTIQGFYLWNSPQ